MFADLSHLKHFDISKNNLTFLKGNVFEQALNLESINLSKNSMDEIDSNIFTNLKRLTLLDLSYNKLKSHNFLPHESLAFLNLSYNKYQQLNNSAVFGLDVELSGNFWNCKWLLEEIVIKSLNRFHFSKKYIVTTKNEVYNFEGIDCNDDETGQLRNFVIIQNNTECNIESFKVNNLHY